MNEKIHVTGVSPLQVVNWKVGSIVQTNVMCWDSAAMTNAVRQQIKIYPGGKNKTIEHDKHVQSGTLNVLLP